MDPYFMDAEVAAEVVAEVVAMAAEAVGGMEAVEGTEAVEDVVEVVVAEAVVQVAFRAK